MAIDKDIFLRRSREAFSASTSYFDNNARAKIDNAYRHFSGQHHAGSKYLKPSYKYRSKGFRPKTRAFIRSSEAKAVAALFANDDVVSIEAQDRNNPMQVASALITKALLNYRLTTTIPWFKIFVGGVQDANITGCVCSYQYWETRSERVFKPFYDDSGNQVVDDEGFELYEEAQELIEDKPVIELRPLNNIRLSPTADWTDPINTSPYLIDILPMHIIDVESKMAEVDRKTGEAKWRKLTREQMMASRNATDDSTAQVMRGYTEDPNNVNLAEIINDYTIVFVHRVFIKYGRHDYVAYTMGTEYLLTDPVSIDEIYWTGDRPYVLGTCMIESHKVVPDSLAHLIAPLQQEANEISNQRRDNVKLVLNKRFLARRGAQIDYQSLMRNAAGSITLMNDPKSDVVPVDIQDVTGSSYAEQDRINTDFDEITGAFSTSSLATNANLNETVGGMSMLRSGGNELNAYSIKTLVETWVEPVMRQLVKLEQKYETDDAVLAIAADKAKIYERFGTDIRLDSLLKQSLTTRVNIGLDATDPLTRANKLIFAVRSISEILMNPPQGLNTVEVVKEIFGSLGYNDGTRFYKEDGPDPQVAQMQQAMQMMQEQIKQMQVALFERSEDRKLQDKIASEKLQADIVKKQIDAQTKLAAMANSQDQQDKKISADMIKTKFEESNQNRRTEAEIAKDIMIAVMNSDGNKEVVKDVAVSI